MSCIYRGIALLVVLTGSTGCANPVGSDSANTIPAVCVELAQTNAIEGPYAMSVGIKGNQTVCYASFAQTPELRNVCTDSLGARVVSNNMMDRSLESCLRDGAANCHVIVTHLGLVTNGRVVAPLPARSGLPNLMRPLAAPYSPIPQQTLERFVGTWAKVTDEHGKLVGKDVSGNICGSPEADEVTVGFRPTQPTAFNPLTNYRDFWRYIFAKWSYGGEGAVEGQYRVRSGSSDRIQIIDAGGDDWGTCFDELNITLLEWRQKYPGELLKPVGDRITTLSTWSIDDRGRTLTISGLDGDDGKYQRCE